MESIHLLAREGLCNDTRMIPSGGGLCQPFQEKRPAYEYQGFQD